MKKHGGRTILTWTDSSRHSILFLLLVGLSVSSLGTGCLAASSGSSKSNSGGRSLSAVTAVQPDAANIDNPTIAYIGETAILKYQPGKELQIPIMGEDLFDDKYAWSVTVDGVVPAIRGQDYDVLTFGDSPENPLVSVGKAVVVLKTNYIASVKDGDTLTVSAQIVDTRAGKIRQLLQMLKTAGDEVNNMIPALAKTNLEQVWTDLQSNKYELMNFANPEYLSPNGIQQLHSLGNSFPEKPTPGQLPTDSNTEETKEKYQELAVNLNNTRQVLAEQAVLQHRFKTMATGFRAFQLYSPDTYREKFLKTRLQLNEIKAFPLPDSQAEEVFGPKIVEHYYVVVFSAVNDSDEERIINSGLINAYGRALVYSAKDGDYPAYSIPVQVSPDSMQQVYSDVVSSKWNTPREWIFRSLDFAGALASAYATGFRGTPDLIKGLGLATSTVIPGAKVLWPDQVPNYLLNIVNFGMPELVKIPKNSSLGFKLLFFSKDKLHSMISDPAMFGQYKNNPLQRGPEAPKTFVVYLSFDTLEVPFEITSAKNSTNGVPTSFTATIQPPSKTVHSGQKFQFSINVSGTPPFTYQWYFGNDPLPGETNATLSFPSEVASGTNSVSATGVTTSQAGFYRVRVTNPDTGESVTSDNAVLQAQ